MNNHIENFYSFLNLQGKKQTTITNYRLYLKRFVDYSCNIPVGKINLKLIIDFHAHLLTKHSPATASYHVASIKSFLKYLEKMEIKSLNPAILDIPKYQRKEANFLKRDELHKLLKAANPAFDLRDRVILEVLASTGARLAELLNFRVKDIDLNKKTVRVINGKNDKSRLVFLTQEASEFLKRYIIMENLKDKDKLFSITSRSVQRMVTKYCKKAGVKRISPHSIRHSLATSLLQRGTNLRQVQALLGHNSILTTQIYTHITDGELQKAYNLAQSPFATSPDGTITTNEFVIMSKENYYSLMGKLNKLLQFQKQILDKIDKKEESTT